MKIFLTISILLFSICSFSQTLDERVSELNQLIANQEYGVALNKCNKFLKEENSHPELYLLKAQCLMEGKRFFVNNENLYQETILALNSAIFLDSNYNYPHGRRGLLNVINKKFDLAISDYSKFISLSTDSVDLFNGLTDRGTAKSFIRNYSGAIDDYSEALKYDPTNKSIYQNLGAIYIDAGMFDEAINILATGLELYPKDVGMLNNVGFLHIQTKQYAKAIPYFDKSIDIDEKDFLAYGNRGYCFINLGKLKKARNDLDQSILLNPNNSYVYKYDAFYFMAINETKEACESLKKAIDFGYSKIYGNEVNQLIEENCK
jgi:tetratricopeptide (TPR) repeat protein